MNKGLGFHSQLKTIFWMSVEFRYIHRKFCTAVYIMEKHKVVSPKRQPGNNFVKHKKIPIRPPQLLSSFFMGSLFHELK